MYIFDLPVLLQPMPAIKNPKPNSISLFDHHSLLLQTAHEVVLKRLQLIIRIDTTYTA